MAAEALVAHVWYLEIDNVQSATFKSVSGGDAEIEVVEHREAGQKGNIVVKKLPGNIKYSNITLNRGVTDDSKLYDWFKQAINGEFPAVRKNGTLTMYSPDMKIVRQISFTNGWPCKYKGAEVGSDKNEVVVEEVELAVEKVEKTK